MGNVRGEMQITAEGQTYTLAYNFLAIVRIEEFLLPEELHDVFARWNKGTFRNKDIVALLWGGLRQAHPGITVEQCGAIIDAIGASGLMNHMLDAMRMANNPTNEKASVEGNVTAGAGSGSHS